MIRTDILTCLSDLGFEAHIQHTVRLIEDHKRDPMQRAVPLV